MTRLLPVAIFVLFLAGCSPAGTGTLVAPDQNAAPLFSLVSGDAEALDESAIATLLSAQFQIPSDGRIAILQAPSRTVSRPHRYFGLTERELRAQQAYVDTLRAHLHPGAAREVVFLPALLVPDEPTIPVLREIAVRLQADGLLVLQITSDLFQEYRLFRSNQFKAYATAEAVLLDVRSGAIPYTTVVTREYLTTKQPQDLTDEDARRRAEQEAALLALSQLGREVHAFITIER